MKQVYIGFAGHATVAAAVAPIVERLEAAGISCFLPTRDVPQDTGYAKALAAAIRECALYLLVMNRAAGESEQVKNELDLAVCERKLVLPVFVEEVTLDPELRYYIGRKQWCVAYPGSVKDYLDKILRTVTEMLPSAPQPPRPAAPPPVTVRPPVTEGDGPFVFISYAHADKERVMPIVAAMQAAGIRVWYDNGIEAGSEWPEYIAGKVATCEKFLSLISPAYLASQNCKRELNFAISRPKELLSVYLEEVELTLGMEMQLGTYQAMYLQRFDTPEQFNDALCRARFFDPCRE